MFIGVLYAVGMGIRGEWLAGVVGGVLAAILCVLVLRAYESQARERRERRGR